MAVKLLEKEVERGHFNYRHINPYLVTYHFGPLTRKITKFIQVFFVLPNTENFSGCLNFPVAILNRVGLRIGKSYHCFVSFPALKTSLNSIQWKSLF